MLRKCRFPDEGSLKLFSYYTKANCELECAWKKAEEICGCKPWQIPAEDGVKTCFIFGITCFDQIMKKIQKGELSTKCSCEDDCIYSRYTLSLSDKTISERTSSNVFFKYPGFSILGTDQMDGNDFSKTSYHNMGNEYIPI